MKLNRRTRRLLKRIGNSVVAIFIVVSTIIGSNFYHNMKSNKGISAPQRKVVEMQETYNLDKINEILRKNNLEVLDINFNATYNKTVVDEPLFKIFGDTFAEFRKKVANKTLNLTADFNAIYKYDLSKLEAVRIGDVTVIQLKEGDLELSVQYKDVETTQKYGILATHFTPQQVTDIEAEMREKAYNDISIRGDYKIEALQNTKNSLLELFDKCGIETNDILIKL